MQAQAIYQQYLREEFERRKSRRSSYSLRAFARDLGIPAPKLSQYLAGLRGMSEKRASDLAEKLRLGPVESELFVCAVKAAHARDPITRETSLRRLRELMANTFSEINMEKFSAIRDWHHFAILELTDLKSFQSNYDWIAAALKIRSEEVQDAVDRLVKLGLLEKSEDSWRQIDRDLETPADFSSRATRDFQHQMLNLVESRLESVPREKRELGTVMLGVDEDLIPEFKQLVRRFQSEAIALSNRGQKRDSLYVLNFQLMPLYQGETS